MSKDEKINIRIRALKYNLDKLNESFELTKRDVFTETGMEYDKKYHYNEETINILQIQDEPKNQKSYFLARIWTKNETEK